MRLKNKKIKHYISTAGSKTVQGQKATSYCHRDARSSPSTRWPSFPHRALERPLQATSAAWPCARWGLSPYDSDVHHFPHSPKETKAFIKGRKTSLPKRKISNECKKILLWQIHQFHILQKKRYNESQSGGTEHRHDVKNWQQNKFTCTPAWSHIPLLPIYTTYTTQNS